MSNFKQVLSKIKGRAELGARGVGNVGEGTAKLVGGGAVAFADKFVHPGSATPKGGRTALSGADQAFKGVGQIKAAIKLRRK